MIDVIEATAVHAETESKYYVWTFPGCPVKVHLDLKVVERLQAGLALSGNSAGEQGVLFGQMIGRVTEISDSQTLARDEPDVARAIMALDNRGSERRLVGYYRIQEAGTLSLNPADSSLFQSGLPPRCHVLLMIQVAGSGPAQATFFYQEDGGMSSDVFNEFPFDAELLGPAEPFEAPQESEKAAENVAENIALPAAAPPEPEPLSMPPAAAAEPEVKPAVAPPVQVEAAPAVQPNLEPTTPPLPALEVVAQEVVAKEVVAKEVVPKEVVAQEVVAKKAAEESAPPAIGVPRFCADVSERRSLVSNVGVWTTVAASVLVGGIWVGSRTFSGRSSRTLPNAVQVKSAQAPAATLPVTSSPAAAAGSTAASPAPSGQAEAAPPKEPAVQAPVQQSAPADAPNRVAKTAASKPAPVAAVRLAPANPSGHLVKPFVPPPANAGVQSAPAVFDMAPAAAASANPILPVSLAITNPRLPEPLKPPVQPAAPVVPAGLGAKEPVRVQPAQKDESAIRPAVVVSQVSPRFPQELKSLVISQKTVNVRVTLDETGRVLTAKALPLQNLHALLLDAAVKAAERSRFQPARKGDQPIASELVLRFTITPQQ